MQLVIEGSDMGWRYTIAGGDPKYMRGLGGFVPSRGEAETLGAAALAEAERRELEGDAPPRPLANPSSVIVEGVAPADAEPA